MPNTLLETRLRIRTLADDADDLVISSVDGDTNPYVLEWADGDGQSFDPLEGEIMTGAYSIRIIDAETAANTRVLTAKLADAGARQQLLQRRAYIEERENAGAWSSLVAGYITSLQLDSSLVYSVHVGQTRRIEVTREIFKKTTSRFDKVTTLIGGPIRGGFGPIRDYGGWKVRVTQTVNSPRYVQLKIVSGFDPRKYNGTFNTLSSAIVDYMCEYARPFYRESDTWRSKGIQGHFPGLKYRVQTTAGSLVGEYAALPEPAQVGFAGEVLVPMRLTRTGESSFWLHWTDSLPSVGTQYNIYLYSDEISEDNPLHILDHPVDLWEDTALDAGISYDSSVLAGVKATIGNDLRLALRITEPSKLGEFWQKVIYAPFGLSTRVNDSGQLVLFSHRIKSSSGPAETIDMTKVRDFESTIFDLDESTICNKVIFKDHLMMRWAPEDGGQPTADSIMMVPRTVEVENGDPALGYTEREVIYEIPGTIQTSSGQAVDLEQFATGVGYEIFDRYGRGAIGGEVHCLRGVTAALGSEIILDLPHLPNAVVGQSPVSQRGGQRIVQVVQRTPRPGGVDIKVLDSGTSAQASTAPTFTIAKSATEPRKFALISITNAATLAAAGYTVRIEIAYGSSTPASGTLLKIVNPASETSLTTPSVDAGTKVWARMRSESADRRPSSWTAFAGIQLDVLQPVTSLVATAQDATDISTRTLTWTVGTNSSDIPIEVLLDAIVVEVLPPGSKQFILTGLTVASRTATVRHKESAPYAGESADASVAVNTTGDATTLDPPQHPAAFAGSLNEQGILVADGTYGIEVTATELPSNVEVWQYTTGITGPASMSVATMAALSVEDAAAMWADFEPIATVPSVHGSRTRWTGRAANDGITRELKAKHTAAGYTSSGYTTTVDVIPWSVQAPTIIPEVTTVATLQVDTGYVLVTGTSTRLGVFRLYRKQGSAATVNDTLLYTSPPDKGTMSYTDTTGAASTTYHYLITLTDVDGNTNDTTEAACKASATFPAAPVPSGIIAYMIMSGDAYNKTYYIGSTASLDFEIAYQDAAVGNYLHLWMSINGSTYARVATLNAGAAGTDVWFPSIPLLWQTVGLLFIKVTLTTTSSPTSAIIDSKQDQTYTGYRWFTPI